MTEEDKLQKLQELFERKAVAANQARQQYTARSHDFQRMAGRAAVWEEAARIVSDARNGYSFEIPKVKAF